MADRPEILVLIEPSLRVLDTMKEEILALDRAIENLCEEKYPETKRLRQIRGVGSITALCFVLTIGDPKRFDRPREVGAFLGLVPKRDQSGRIDKELRISKAGDKYLRRLLVGSAQYILGPFGDDCELQRQGIRLIERGGREAKKKAVVATARKLAVVMMTIWRNGSDYRPMGKAA